MSRPLKAFHRRAEVQRYDAETEASVTLDPYHVRPGA